MFNTFIKFCFVMQMLIIIPVHATAAILITLIIIATSLLESFSLIWIVVTSS